VRIIIERGNPVVYERIFGRKAGKKIWIKKRRVALSRNPAFSTLPHQ
jgi:hypothetical protein